MIWKEMIVECRLMVKFWMFFCGLVELHWFNLLWMGASIFIKFVIFIWIFDLFLFFTCFLLLNLVRNLQFIITPPRYLFYLKSWISFSQRIYGKYLKINIKSQFFSQPYEIWLKQKPALDILGKTSPFYIIEYWLVWIDCQYPNITNFSQISNEFYPWISNAVSWIEY